MKKQHAIHNEKTCDYLLASNQFNDWVITTAFYSALHYVQHEMFPMYESGKSHSNFENYFNNVLKRKNKRINKHSATIELVKHKLPKCSNYYRWLYDACMNARYNNYSVSSQKASTAKIYLTEIKKHLKK